ncbi:MAG: 2,3-diphosphoglycerate-dependent phosphoglycerate mutase [Acidobacteria bacterium]|nr:2,3-diphosphoglycerate-dependent phosphoglycerate mutase [Acidobacteriota bacterium]
MTGTLVLLRHGQSTWNELNLFTGWHDVELTALGEREATAAGAVMRDEGLRFDFAHTSVLTRAAMTCHLALREMGQVWLPLQRHWRLNERHYGALQGLDKKATAARHGDEQTNLWRRSFDVPPPAVESSSPEHPVNDPRYRFIDRAALPATECLKDVVARVLPYWNSEVVPQLQTDMNVLVTAHGNSLRALVMYLEGISKADIAELNIPTGVPRRYAFDSSMKVTEVAYLGDQAAIAAAAAAVANQSK